MDAATTASTILTVDADFWTEIDQASRRRRIRWAVGALVATLAVSGTMASGPAGGGAADQVARPEIVVAGA